jgi:hypothetical protein
LFSIFFYHYYRVSFRRKKKEEPAKEVPAKTAVKEEPKKVSKFDSFLIFIGS